MNCESCAEQLSPFIDGELDSQRSLAIQEHLDGCANCRQQFEQCGAIGELMRRSEASIESAPAWEAIEGQLERQLEGQFSRRTTVRPPSRWSSWSVAALATAASIGLLIYTFSGLSNWKHDNSHSHDAMAVDFEDVVKHAQTEPNIAIGKLVAKYQGRELDNEATTVYLGYEPALFKSLPVGFQRTSTHVLNMPCCKCSATICQRSDGTSLVVFEHKEEQPVWFGNASCIETQCAGQPCKIIQALGNMAVTWKHKDRQLTMVGAKDIAEIDKWVLAIKM